MNFASKWFLLYYIILGFALVGGGIYLALSNNRIATFFTDAAANEKPPRLLVRILKYFLLFTLPGLALSFMPFSIIELLFTVWSLFLVYLVGIRLVRWKESRALIRTKSDELPGLICKSGAIMVAVGFAIFLLAYAVLNRASL